MQLKLREKLIKEIRKFKPQTIISFDISNIFDENPDHKLLSKIVLESALFSAYPLIHKEHYNEGLKPHFMSRVLMTPTTLPNLYLNIDKIDLNNKIKAGFAYKSQLELMYNEFKNPPSDYEIDIPFKNIPIEELWPMICESDAKSCAEKAKKFYKENLYINPYSEQELSRFEYAEEFRVVFLGVLEKIKNILPKELYKIFFKSLLNNFLIFLVEVFISKSYEFFNY